MTAVIRRAQVWDVLALSRLAQSTFRETFVEGYGIPYPPADLAEFMAGACGARAFAAMLGDPKMGVWIAEDGGEAVAYATAGPCALPHDEVKPWDGEVKRLYVAKTHQGMALGKALLSTVITWLEAERGPVQWLGVWSGNLRALGLYTAFGFERAGEYDFPVGAHIDHEYILRRGPKG